MMDKMTTATVTDDVELCLNATKQDIGKILVLRVAVRLNKPLSPLKYLLSIYRYVTDRRMERQAEKNLQRGLFKWPDKQDNCIFLYAIYTVFLKRMHCIPSNGCSGVHKRYR